MQFIKNGPDIPERLIEEHESGRLVFFCGAGISYPAGLPGFEGLVNQLLKGLGVDPTPVLKAALKAKKFDTSIGLLESELPGGREAVRSHLEGILAPATISSNALLTHEALLTLAKTRDEKTRLITTNFDRLFEEVINQKKISISSFHAPLLPVPKNKWDGLVYLHGFLKEAANASDLDRLVLSSGDFGLAYLTERWAARFVSELFRNYTVCFVGYSIDDPVLRYMMDALAADRLLGESPPEMYAFGSYKKNKKAEYENQWKAKNVTPILYVENKTHKYLHGTLREWANTYRDGILGKENLVSKYALTVPMASTVQDDYSGRLLWALTEPNGLPAKRFADFDPAPSLDWLEAFNESRYSDDELVKFGIEIKEGRGKGELYSLLRRPTPYWLSPLMSLVGSTYGRAEMDTPMTHLARWLTRHLGDPKLLLWFSKQGAHLNLHVQRLMQSRLREIALEEKRNDANELADIIKRSPNYFPSPKIRLLWNLMLSGRIFSKSHDGDLYQWFHNFETEGLNTASLTKLKKILSPHVLLRKAIEWRVAEGVNNGEMAPKDLIDWEVVLGADHLHFAIRQFSEKPEWILALPKLFEDFNALLLETLNLKAELGDADYWRDFSYIDNPSISEHLQNRDFHDWTVLISLCRQSWLTVATGNCDKALLYAEMWMQQPYPIFKRLAFFAATQANIVDPQKALQWLLSDDSWWLWSVETQREVMRLLVHLATALNAKQHSELEGHIRQGPPRKMFNEKMMPDAWIRIQDHSIWLRLNKLFAVNQKLNQESTSLLRDIERRYPSWQYLNSEQEEFPYFLESGWSGMGDPWRTFTPTPIGQRGLLNYILSAPNLEGAKDDDWPARCKSNLQLTAYTLGFLARRNIWPKERWRQALEVWSQEGLFIDSWNWVGPILATAPNHFLTEIIQAVCWWLEGLAKVFERHEVKFIEICKKIIDLNIEFEKSKEIFTESINHPIGQVTESLLRWWYRSKPEDKQLLPPDLKEIFSRICESGVKNYIPGKVVLARHVISLYRVDKLWAQTHLIPYFSWELHPDAAPYMWEAFLWAPRSYAPLMREMKNSFLEIANHLPLLEKQVRPYASLLTFMALEQQGVFNGAELARATQALPPEGLIECARALCQGLEASSEQRNEYWENRIEPYFHEVWPKLRSLSDGERDQLSEVFSRLCIESGDNFIGAFKMLRAWIRPLKHPFYILQQIVESGIATKFPLATLTFIDILIAEDAQLMLTNLGVVLDAIVGCSPGIQVDKKFIRLRNQLRGSFG